MRLRVLEEIREAMRVERVGARQAYTVRLGEARGIKDDIQRVRAELVAEKDHQAELRRLERADYTRPPRHLIDPDPHPTLGVRAVIGAIEELARARGLKGYRVGYKRNARGEHVVALIFRKPSTNDVRPRTFGAAGEGKGMTLPRPW